MSATKGRFFLLDLLALFLFTEVRIDPDIALVLIFAQVEDFKGTVIFACFL